VKIEILIAGLILLLTAFLPLTYDAVQAKTATALDCKSPRPQRGEVQIALTGDSLTTMRLSVHSESAVSAHDRSGSLL
jgi:hypothetical protein